MIGFFLIGLGVCIPILSVIFKIIVAPNKRFFFINSYDFDDFSPLVNYISFLISFDYKRFNMIKVINSIFHIKIVIDMDILRIEHLLVLKHFLEKVI